MNGRWAAMGTVLQEWVRAALLAAHTS